MAVVASRGHWVNATADTAANDEPAVSASMMAAVDKAAVAASTVVHRRHDRNDRTAASDTAATAAVATAVSSIHQVAMTAATVAAALVLTPTVSVARRQAASRRRTARRGAHNSPAWCPGDSELRWFRLLFVSVCVC